jgi:hypothetical protein
MFLSPYEGPPALIVTKKKKMRVVIPRNDYVPETMPPDTMIRHSQVNASAADVFRVAGDVGAFKTWAGYGIKSIRMVEGHKFGSAITRYEAGIAGVV